MKLAYRFEGRLCDLALWFGFGLFREVAIIFYGDIMRLIILRIIGLGEYWDWYKRTINIDAELRVVLIPHINCILSEHWAVIIFCVIWDAS